VLNDTGTFGYYEANVNDEDPDFVMNGTIDVINQQLPLPLQQASSYSSSSSSSSSINTTTSGSSE
jgi:hypothetical protein